MNILVVGGGGREHAIIKKLRDNPAVQTIWALPGNGGIAMDATCVPISATDIEGIVAFAKENPVDFAVVAPDDPLVMGVVDRLNEISIPAFGPTAKAAILEGSKAFAKDFMHRHNIPTAQYVVCDTVEEAEAALLDAEFPLVVKADGLALGKGVLICETFDAAQDAIREMMVKGRFGKSGRRVVLEEFLTGPEVSVLAFTDGTAMVPMASSMDHKRAYDGDEGPNTGGMGAIAPNPYYTKEIARRCMEEIFLPTMRGMNEEGRVFKGCLYFGLMLTGDGPKVIEYNCRFGDPETQVVLPLLKTDLLTVMQAVADGELSKTPVEFSSGAACCVVIASGGYPGAYEKGLPVEIDVKDALVYHAGTAIKDGRLVSAGGRLLGITAVAQDLPEAMEKAYMAVAAIRVSGGFYRRDIGRRALAACEKKGVE